MVRFFGKNRTRLEVEKRAESLSQFADVRLMTLIADCEFKGQSIGWQSPTEFPAHFEWQNSQEGPCAIGVEPLTNHVLGKPSANKRDELIRLEHNQVRNYHTIFRIHDGVDALSVWREKIHSIGSQPESSYPAITGNYRKINNVEIRK